MVKELKQTLKFIWNDLSYEGTIEFKKNTILLAMVRGQGTRQFKVVYTKMAKYGDDDQTVPAIYKMESSITVPEGMPMDAVEAYLEQAVGFVFIGTERGVSALNQKLGAEEMD